MTGAAGRGSDRPPVRDPPPNSEVLCEKSPDGATQAARVVAANKLTPLADMKFLILSIFPHSA